MNKKIIQIMPARIRRMRGLGDAVHAVANPIARAIDAVAGTDIQHCKGCVGDGGRRDRLNKAVPFNR